MTSISQCIIISLNGGDNVYARLKELRESLGLTQAEFGNSIGIAKSTYNNYETGIRDPKSDFWISVAQKYGVTIDYLMGFSDNPHPAETKKSPSTTEAVPGDDKVFDLYDALNTMLVSAGIIKGGEDITKKQSDVLIAVCRIIDATFKD